MNSSQSSSLYFGIDGGGTRTRSVAVDGSGKVLGTGSSTCSNPNNIGFAKAAHRILDAIESTRVTLNEKTSLCLGIAGLADEEAKDRLQEELLNALPDLAGSQLILTHDLHIAHEAAFGGKPGIVLIAGTGSACYSMDKQGRTLRTSGRSYSYEDPGSGYAIGKRAIESKLLLDTESRQSIAALAPRVIELAAEGDLRALDILRIEAENLAKLVQPLFAKFKEVDALPTLALSGGILTTDSLYRDTALFELQSALPGIQIIDTKMAPEMGAVEIAKRASHPTRSM